MAYCSTLSGCCRPIKGRLLYDMAHLVSQDQPVAVRFWDLGPAHQDAAGGGSEGRDIGGAAGRNYWRRRRCSVRTFEMSLGETQSLHYITRLARANYISRKYECSLRNPKVQ